MAGMIGAEKVMALFLKCGLFTTILDIFILLKIQFPGSLLRSTRSLELKT